MDTVARTDFFTAQPAVGTRVILPEANSNSLWYSRYGGVAGKVAQIQDTRTVRVEFDNGGRDYGEWDLLVPERVVSAHPTEIILDGQRYTLTPVPDAPAPEVKREPQRGEVWQNITSDRYFLVCAENRIVEVPDGRLMWISPAELINQGGQLGYSTLAAAFAAGVLS